MKSRLIAIALALFLGVGLIGLALTPGCRKASGPRVEAVKYHCPMHPTVVSDKPGDCPICGMRLVPMEKQPAEPTDVKPEAAAPGAEKPAAAQKKIMYRSTMNPKEISDKPGKDSMGMEMVAFEVEEGGEESRPKGLAAVSIGPETRQRMGLTLGTVEKRKLFRDVRTSARIVADETRLYKVTTKVEGWVDTLFVNVTGQQVTKGDPLLAIYSPELVSTQQEYLTALGSVKLMAQGSDDVAARGAASLLDAARRRLEFWDVSDNQIKRLEQTGKIEKNLTLYSPADGWVTEKNVLAGQKIMAGEPLLVISDLTRVWGDADIYQTDLPYVRVGMSAEITIPYWDGKSFQGTVAFIAPTVDPETRTVKARLNIANSELLLKPEMYADARLSFPIGEATAIPEAAVMRTGEHIYAFKDGGDGRLIPVEIRIGPRGDGYFQLLGGLSEGDKVVTSANFLVDSESSLKAALEAMAKVGETGADSTAGGHEH